MEILVWGGVVVCLVHSGLFSGLNLAMFGLSPLELEAQAAAGNIHAVRLRDMRRDSNSLLATLVSFSNEIARFCEALPGADAATVLGGLHLDRRLSPRDGGRRIELRRAKINPPPALRRAPPL